VQACVGRGTRADRTCTPSRVESMKVRSRIPIESDELNERIKNINGKTMNECVLRPRDRRMVQRSGLGEHQAKTDTELTWRVIERGGAARRKTGDREGTKE